jgi:hypothetical protein
MKDTKNVKQKNNNMKKDKSIKSRESDLGTPDFETGVLTTLPDVVS